MACGDIEALEKSIAEKLPKNDSHGPQISSKEETIITIPVVPERLRLGENDAYEPKIISFGPYHHNKPHVQAMEKHKLRFLQAILNRNSDHSLKNYIEKIKYFEGKAKCCYSESIKINDNFIEMMLLDGCFIVEFLLLVHDKSSDELANMIWVRHLILHDMLLLENQLPFCIVDCIYELATKISGDQSYPSSFKDLAINYFNHVSKKKVSLPKLYPKSVHHVLHLYHSFCVYTSGEEEATPIHVVGIENDEAEVMIPSATMLEEAGIKFQRNEMKECSIFDITFSKGVMKIPPLHVDSFTKSKFRNLIAFEQFYPNFQREFPKNFTTYVAFMDSIICEHKDVEFLYDKGILQHVLGSNEQVADLFNHLNRGTFRNREHYLSGLYKEVYKYRKVKIHRWRANLMHNYLNNPWAGISVAAAGILLVLTFLQTVFSGYSAF